MGTIISINVGQPKRLEVSGHRPILSSISRSPVGQRIFLDVAGLEGDRVADPVHHGGPDKAVCVYSADHFSHWEDFLGRSLQPSAFGENFTVEGLIETEVCIDDIYQIGDAQVQVSQPRMPCHKLNKVFGLAEMACQVKTTGFTGYYVRVLRQGWVAPGMPVVLQERSQPKFSIQRVNDLLDADHFTPELASELVESTRLSHDWKNLFTKRLRGRLETPK